MPSVGQMIIDKKKEIARLEKELGRAYRALHGFRMAHVRGERLDETAVAYHAPTIGAATRFVKEGALDGAEYFVGKPIEVLHDVLASRLCDRGE